VQVGKVKIGGDAPVSIQSMTKTRTEDIDATVEQIRQLTAGGCDIIRCAVPDEKAAASLKEIIPQVSIQWWPTFTSIIVWRCRPLKWGA